MEWGGWLGGPFIIPGERNSDLDSVVAVGISDRWSDPEGVWETLSGNMDWM